MIKNKYIAAIAIILAASIWAFDAVVFRPSLYKLNAISVVFVEHFLALCITSPFLIPHIRKINWKDKKSISILVLIAFCGGVLGTSAFTHALSLTYSAGVAPSTVFLLQKIQPIFAIVLAFVLLRERPTRIFFFYIAIALIGSYLLTFGLNNPNLSFSEIIPPLLALVAAACWGFSTTLGKLVLNRFSFEQTAFLRLLFTTFISGALVAILPGSFSVFESYNSDHIRTLILIGIFTGSIALFMYYWGLRRIKASAATIFELAWPVVALFLDFVINDQYITMFQAVGMLLLTTSMLLLAREKEAFKGDLATIYTKKSIS